MPKNIHVHFHDETSSDYARAANVQLGAVKRYANSLSMIRLGDHELTQAEGCISDVKELMQVCQRAIDALDKVVG